ncbi:MAG TPA: choice-of-anchor E domain-containing protein [Puia sp.]|nr:choice-of-anchor E domain-containing protein [Puia sp.]
MNRVYTVSFIVIVLIISLPGVVLAQCNCTGGVPATPVTYFDSFPSTTAASVTLTFPQFDPSVGTLSCLSVWDTAFGASTTHATNLDTADYVEYSFLLSLTESLQGPSGGGINISSSNNATYGPSTLSPYGLAGDTIRYGPDSLFKGVAGFGSTVANTTPYLGTGSVKFKFSISGGVITTEGGANYNAGPTTSYAGKVRITYYWCPAVSLATGIQNFTVAPEGNSLLLQWLTQNQQPNTQYEIQVSQDGQNFSNIGQAQSNASATGTAAKYQDQYYPDPSYVGKLYFRIVETDATGRVSISTVLVYDPTGGPGDISYQTFPNPATNSLQVQFNSNQTGRFLLELVATSGQVVRQEEATLAGTSMLRLDLNPHPARGLYFLRTTDVTHNRSYVSKVFIN